jgi:hypothetical protein
MRKEDVKIGMKVRETYTGDIGYVTDVEHELLDSSVWVKWVNTRDNWDANQELHIDVSAIEPVELEVENLQQEDHSSFKINQKVKKVVTEVKEVESFTITLSPKAAHELRALMGSCNSDSSLRKETKELCEYLYDEDADGLITFLGTGLLIDFDEAKEWTKFH